MDSLFLFVLFHDITYSWHCHSWWRTKNANIRGSIFRLGATFAGRYTHACRQLNILSAPESTLTSIQDTCTTHDTTPLGTRKGHEIPRCHVIHLRVRIMMTLGKSGVLSVQGDPFNYKKAWRWWNLRLDQKVLVRSFVN